MTTFALVLSALWLGIIGVSAIATAGSAVSAGRSGLVMLYTAMAMGAVLVPFLRRSLTSILPFDPDNPVHLTALSLSLALIGVVIAGQIAVNTLAPSNQAPPLERVDLFLQSLPFLLIALIGVGIFLRRSPRAALERLGFVRPAPWQVLLGLASAGLLVAVNFGFGALASYLTPTLNHQVDIASTKVFSHVSDPTSFILQALLAGICEEAFFRGALQPRLGLVVASVTFAILHTEYGLSIDIVAVFVLALGLGVIRRYANTTTSAITHVTHNLVVSIVASINVVAALFYSAIGVETAMVLVLVGFWVWTRRRGAEAPTQEPV
jgi:hypothetical protein